MKNNALLLSMLVLASIVIAGCAATPIVSQSVPIEADLSRYSAIQIIVDAPENIRGLAGYDISASELRREFAANIVASGKFVTVSTEARNPKGLEARLSITRFNYVSGAARGGIGILAGRAILYVTMTLRDTDTARVVGIVDARHESSHGQGVFSPVTSTQITAIAKELAARFTNK